MDISEILLSNMQNITMKTKKTEEYKVKDILQNSGLNSLTPQKLLEPKKKKTRKTSIFRKTKKKKT